MGNTYNTKCWQECEATGTLIHCCWEGTMVQPLWKTVWCYLIELNLLIYHSSITLLDIYSNKLKLHVHRKTCMWMFIAALLTSVQICKPPRCPLVYEKINKLWYIQTMEQYSAMKRSELSSHEKIWRKQMHITKLKKLTI